MPTLQVRNVPDSVHRRLKARSAAAGQSLSEYVLTELTRVAERPTLAELTERIDQLGRVPLTADAVDVLAAERAARP